jgi:transposase InsO family protein
MAIAFRAPPKGCTHHTDRGSQYCSHDYQKILRHHGFKASMSGKGNCYEFNPVRASGLNDLGDHSKAQNAAVETFFKTIKAELAASFGNTAASRDGNLRRHQRPRKSASPPFSTGLEKPCRFRTKGGLNEHLGRHESVTGPNRCALAQALRSAP